MPIDLIGFEGCINSENSAKWMGIGLGVSNSPTGPFVDHISAPLWTEPYANDPCLLVDDDGTPYLYVHAMGADYKVIELTDDMEAVEGV
ncbi:hypothetical protein Q2T41_08710 [Maribacter confluentis]|uniref:Uncharacterized protein n=1 Tax=Maribacter confluentis TaxID=1656093 RepID=A0ABT8RP88_9FLAO|nr:hypothetical protein [Maribacter confluentis]MDO1512735.1 hypothetical protein [Maribacter confluentis]